MALITLLEAMKYHQNEGKFIEAVIAELYAGSSGVLENIPFQRIRGNSIQYQMEMIRPSVSFRSLNSDYTDIDGQIINVLEGLSYMGGHIDVDNQELLTGSVLKESKISQKTRALSLLWTKTFMKGNPAEAGKQFEFKGIEQRLLDPLFINQTIPAGNTSGGNALSLLLLDELIDQVENPTHFIMNKAMLRLLTDASRNSAVSGYLVDSKDNFGRPIKMYAGLPIITLDLDHQNLPILPFTEPAPGGGTAQCTSIYCISFNSLGLHAIEGEMGMNIYPEKLKESNIQSRLATIDWSTSIVIKNPRALARLWGIKYARVTT